MVTIQVCLTLADAEAIQARLEGSGIHVYLPDKLAAETDLPLIQASGGIHILVNESDEARANQILNDSQQG